VKLKTRRLYASSGNGVESFYTGSATIGHSECLTNEFSTSALSPNTPLLNYLVDGGDHATTWFETGYSIQLSYGRVMQSWRTAEALDQGHRRGDGEGAEPGYSDS
jgi:hypothetical protein